MESSSSLGRLRQRFWPTDGGRPIDEEGKTLFGFTVFLLSESVIFLSFITTYIILRTTNSNWLPPGVKGPGLTTAVIINTVVLLSSSLVIYFAERALEHHNLNRFRLLWLTTSAMGAFFLYGEVQEWLQDSKDFVLSTGTVGGTFYITTGFHGLHVFTGIILQMLMLVRSFIPGIYDKGHYGVTAISLFWHFVDVIWVIVFSIFYLWRA